jgi:hypothetical protein
MARFDIKIQLPSDADMKRMFDAVPALERYRVADQVVAAGARPITRRARQLMPRSKASDRAKWSKERREGKGRWAGLDKTALWKTVKLVVRKGERGGAVAVTGPEFTGSGGAGQKVYLVAEHKQRGRRMIFWGRDGGRTKLKVRNVMVQAAGETKGEQLTAMKAKLTTLMDQVWKHG